MPQMNWADGWHHMAGWQDGWMWVWALTMMALVVVGIVGLLRLATPTGPAPEATTTDAERILAERFARGEITADEYGDRLERLRGGTPL